MISRWVSQAPSQWLQELQILSTSVSCANSTHKHHPSSDSPTPNFNRLSSQLQNITNITGDFAFAAGDEQHASLGAVMGMETRIGQGGRGCLVGDFPGNGDKAWVGEYQGQKRRDENEEHDQAKVWAWAWGKIGFATGHWRQGTARWVAVSFEVQWGVGYFAGAVREVGARGLGMDMGFGNWEPGPGLCEAR
ncbi:hypothetical protein L208DRAFT_1378041 [Tricholoma matsutake]|nr:hypothetical protein L208DRAFT_1378041 [Tricholoma matsutake 945]